MVENCMFEIIAAHASDQWVSKLTHKQLETHGCILITADTDALVLKLQGISIYTAE